MRYENLHLPISQHLHKFNPHRRNILPWPHSSPSPTSSDPSLAASARERVSPVSRSASRSWFYFCLRCFSVWTRPDSWLATPAPSYCSSVSSCWRLGSEAAGCSWRTHWGRRCWTPASRPRTLCSLSLMSRPWEDRLQILTIVVFHWPTSKVCSWLQK